MVPAERVKAGDVHQLSRGAVGLCGVEDQRALEAEHAGDGLGQFADGDVFAGADVDERRRVGDEQRVEAGSSRFIRKTQACGKIVAVEELAARRAGAPDDRSLVSLRLSPRRLCG